jgi:FkbM family methyltransferase
MPGLKPMVKRIAQKSGLYVTSTYRLGIEVELDLLRLSFDSPLRTVFDVGANFGQTACRFAKAFPLATIYSFEPVPASFSLLRESVKSIPRVRTFNCALGDAAGSVQINIASSSGSSSLHSIQAATGNLEVSIDTIDEVCVSNQIDEIDLLKIDVEGHELQVLRGASQRLMAGKIRYIYAECVLAPNAEMPHTSFLDLHDFLTKRGFCFVSYYAESFNLRLGCALGNVLYALQERLPTHIAGSVRNIS